MRAVIRVLLAMVVFQLAIGFQVATASAAAKTSPAAAVDHQDCPLHSPSPAPATDKHDCCKVSGAQCQCGGLALAADAGLSRGAPVQSTALPAVAALRASVPTDSLFRPPIAF